MADFCVECAANHGFPTFELDFKEIFASLEVDTMTNVLCEGCNVVHVGNLGGRMFVDRRIFI